MRKIHGMYSKLEKMNKVYRKLAREGRTDHMGTLKSTIFYCNKEWDILQHRVSAILINLRQSAALDDDFKTMKNVLYKWLTDIDVRVTDLEHFSSMNTEAKMAEVKVCMSHGCLCQGSKQHGLSRHLNSIMNYNHKIDIFLEIKRFYISVNPGLVSTSTSSTDCLNFVKL